jgi:hypothetical protein
MMTKDEALVEIKKILENYLWGEPNKQKEIMAALKSEPMGRWISAPSNLTRFGYNPCRCSRCGLLSYHPCTYCPNCGLKMFK